MFASTGNYGLRATAAAAAGRRNLEGSPPGRLTGGPRLQQQLCQAAWQAHASYKPCGTELNADNTVLTAEIETLLRQCLRRQSAHPKSLEDCPPDITEVGGCSLHEAAHKDAGGGHSALEAQGAQQAALHGQHVLPRVRVVRDVAQLLHLCSNRWR